MKFRHLIFAVGIMAALCACDVVRQVGGAYNMVQCKYEYNSISKLSLSGMNLSNGISLAYLPKITSILAGSGSSIPLSFTLNLDVSNPNQGEAIMNGMQYILSIDGIQFTTGSVSQSLNIPSGGTRVMPLAIGFDLATLLKGDTKDAVVGIAKNFIGIGNEKSEVSLKIKPSFNVGGQTVVSPVYIPVNFSFGGAK